MVFHVQYEIEKETRTAALRLGSKNIDSMSLLIQKKLKEMHPDQQGKIKYKIIGLSE
jgi:hypothetical protein